MRTTQHYFDGRSAHATGSRYKTQKKGSHGPAVCFRFHPTKNLAMSTEGVITLNGEYSKKFVEILKSKRWCGIANRKGAIYDITSLGWNLHE